MIAFLLFGLLFGFLLVRVGATDFDAIAQMFLLSDLHLAGVIGVAVAVAAPLLWLLRRRGIAGPEGPIVIAPKPRKPGLVVGGLLFGAGWALTGTCPGTVLAQLGEGQLVALFTVAGIFAGTALHRRTGARVERWLARPRPGARPPVREAPASAIADAPGA
jgi:uncharacterized membrane protein YedE/YeeE